MSDVPPVPRLRALVFFGLLAFMNWGPFAEQVLGFESRYLRSWEMFNKVFDVCDVRYAQIQGGAEVPLDRYAYFGEIAKKSSNIGRIDSVKEATTVGRTLCRKIGGDPDVRAWMSCPTRRGNGWKVEMRGETNLCEGEDKP